MDLEWTKHSTLLMDSAIPVSKSYYIHYYSFYSSVSYVLGLPSPT